ncbi:hypothetical protein AGLY_001056, partial [Aphis glycines]
TFEVSDPNIYLVCQHRNLIGFSKTNRKIVLSDTNHTFCIKYQALINTSWIRLTLSQLMFINIKYSNHKIHEVDLDSRYKDVCKEMTKPHKNTLSKAFPSNKLKSEWTVHSSKNAIHSSTLRVVSVKPLILSGAMNIPARIIFYRMQLYCIQIEYLSKITLSCPRTEGTMDKHPPPKCTDLLFQFQIRGVFILYLFHKIAVPSKRIKKQIDNIINAPMELEPIACFAHLDVDICSINLLLRKFTEHNKLSLKSSGSQTHFFMYHLSILFISHLPLMTKNRKIQIAQLNTLFFIF